MRDLAGARGDLDKAVALMPAEWESWLLSGNLAIREGRWQDGIDDMDKALKLRQSVETPVGDSPAVWMAPILVGRGYAQAALGHWKEAAADLAVVRNPFQKASPSAWADYALVLLKKGDLPDYRAACGQMLATIPKPEGEPRSTIVTTEFGKREVYSFGQPFDPEGAATMTWVCCLSPDALSDFTLPLRFAQRAAGLDKESYPFARAYGAALYRAREYEAAVKQLETARDLKKSPSPSVWLLLAMAHQRRGQGGEAKEWLGKARVWMEETRKRKPDDKSGVVWEQLPWTERVALELLQAEAGKLIPGDAAKP